MKPPKDLKKYIEPSVAAAQLFHLVLERMMLLKPGWKVKWNVSISYWNDNPPKDLKIFPRQGTFHNSYDEALEVPGLSGAEDKRGE